VVTTFLAATWRRLIRDLLPASAERDALAATTPLEWPELEPAPPITLPTANPVRCCACGEPMPFGIAHYCTGRGADYRRSRAA